MDNYLLDTNPESNILIIAFTGFRGRVMMDAFDFFSTTKALNCNRILVKDPSKRLCVGGIGGVLNSIDKLLLQLKIDIDGIKPTKIYCVGSSGGGFTAILFGHLLKADIVYAFSPTTFTDIPTFFKLGLLKRLAKYARRIYNLYRLPFAAWGYFNLRKQLKYPNGTTRFIIHVCSGHKEDSVVANYLGDCPQVYIKYHQCRGHNVLQNMIKNKMLFDLFSYE